jgi:hypothetical protein
VEWDKSKYVVLSKGNTEGKVFPRHVMKGCRWKVSIAPRILNLGFPNAHATLPRGNFLRDPFTGNRRVASCAAGMDVVRTDKSLKLVGIRTPDH